ncbi:MAG: hypothetical protein GVY24_05875 [Planctomycetes bacterium]|nr:hypothetical protein [Planctomycetota bacterium]
MRRKALRILALAWVLAWFGIVLPGHQRGAVRLPGQSSDTTEAETTAAAPGGKPCPLCVREPGGGEGDDSPAVPIRGGCCAICQFMATLSTPPIFVFDPPDSYLLDLLAAPDVAGLRDVCELPTSRSRGPPPIL